MVSCRGHCARSPPASSLLRRREAREPRLSQGARETQSRHARERNSRRTAHWPSRWPERRHHVAQRPLCRWCERRSPAVHRCGWLSIGLASAAHRLRAPSRRHGETALYGAQAIRIDTAARIVGRTSPRPSAKRRPLSLSSRSQLRSCAACRSKGSPPASSAHTRSHATTRATQTVLARHAAMAVAAARARSRSG